jgi:hypothetical protein
MVSDHEAETVSLDSEDSLQETDQAWVVTSGTLSSRETEDELEVEELELEDEDDEDDEDDSTGAAAGSTVETLKELETQWTETDSDGREEMSMDGGVHEVEVSTNWEVETVPSAPVQSGSGIDGREKETDGMV